MQEILPKILTYLFVIVVYAFIYTIIRMIFLDIRTMSRKKNITQAEGFLKLMNLKTDLDFDVKESYELEKDNLIGRSGKCRIRIGDSALSGVHCRIFKAENTFFIEDMDSANGTLLNGEPVSDEVVELIDGDKISIGSLMFLFVRPEN
ncbi:MAG: FHA domain-containing protein [Clostridia bacterium]|nr:FHA domain-containing protein [Clostridia bacterium]